MTYFWIAMGVINKEEKYMEEFMNNSFLVKENTDPDYQNYSFMIGPLSKKSEYYVLHDLLHELSRSISSNECLNIYNSERFRSDDIPRSIRYLSITMQNRCDENFRREMVELKSKIDIKNLRALMIFGEYTRIVVDILDDTFKKIEKLRVLFIDTDSLQTLAHKFSKLIHLRCLKISGSPSHSQLTLPATLSRLYHLKILDLKGYGGSVELPKDISHLLNLCYLFAKRKIHSNVTMVGKMKNLRELKQFSVKKESAGFELSELGTLTELGGRLNIFKLEKVATKREAIEAKLVLKKDLKMLSLVWGSLEADGLEPQHHPDSDVADGLEPHRNLEALSIIDHAGSVGPSWLCRDIRTEMLTYLRLEGVSWVTFPPFGKLLHLTILILSRISGLRQIRPGSSGVTENSFLHLKTIELDRLPDFTEWVGVPNAHSFSRLEIIICGECPNLCALPFLQEWSAGSYNQLSALEIKSCPKLFPPPIPHTSTITTSVEVAPSELYSSPGISFVQGRALTLTGRHCAIAWHNLSDKLEAVTIEDWAEIPWEQLSKLASLMVFEISKLPKFMSIAPLSNLTSLISLHITDCDNLSMDGCNPLITAVDLKELVVRNREGHPRSIAADLLSDLVVASRAEQLLPAAGSFVRLERLEVDSISAVLVAPICTLLAPTLESLEFSWDPRVESLTEEEEEALQLLTSLQTLTFSYCRSLLSLPQGLHNLASLKKLIIFSSTPELRTQAGALWFRNRGLKVDIY